ncbi:MAG TPA: hypothetical protein VJH37_01195 [Candidatus Nanoarchaeia archaeon]|nr:hypothetical protein [Candidatus Nanoarchaeia archaeon]
MTPKKNGQAAVTDLFIAISVFIILITITTLTWNLYNIRLTSRFDYDEMMLKGFQVSDLLVKSKGIPVNWHITYNETAPEVLGLADNERVLSSERIDAFKDLSDRNPALIKDALKINLYNYYFVIRDQTGVPLLNSGLFPSGKYAVNLARIALYNNQPVIVEFAIWK